MANFAGGTTSFLCLVDSITMPSDAVLPANIGGKLNAKQVDSAVAGYTNYHRLGAESEQERKQNYTDMVNKYYDLATSFYEYGWGESFHFAHRWNGETHNESLKRHEHYLALKLQLKPGDKVRCCCCCCCYGWSDNKASVNG